MTWELLLILGIVLLLVSPVGEWLGSIVEEITTGHNVKLNLNPFQQSTIGANTGTSSSGITHGAMIPADNGGSGGTSLFNVPIQDANGVVGSIQVVAHDAASALNNAHQGNNTPIGEPTPA